MPEALPFADGDVGAERAGRLQQAERQRLGGRGDQQAPRSRAPIGAHAAQILDDAEDVRVADDDRGGAAASTFAASQLEVEPPVGAERRFDAARSAGALGR